MSLFYDLDALFPMQFDCVSPNLLTNAHQVVINKLLFFSRFSIIATLAWPG
jgi:hypothetical protein